MRSRFLVCFCFLLFFFTSQASYVFPESRILLKRKIHDNTRFLDSSLQKAENFTSGYIKLLSADSFYGEWSETKAPTPEQPTYTHFDNTQGIVVTNPYDTGSDIVLLDTQYIDKKFIFLSIDFQEIFKDVQPVNGSLKAVDLQLRYWYGDDLLRQGITSMKNCVIKNLTLNFTIKDTGEPYDPEIHKEKEPMIRVKMDGGECLLSFETTLMTSRDERFLSQIWIFSLLYLLWCIPNMMVALAKFKEMDAIDKMEGFQFFLVFNINFYVSMWNNLFAEEIAGNFGLLLVALLNFFIWSSNFGTSLRCMQGRRNPCFLAASIFLTACIRIVFTYSHTILLVVFIAIPLFDIIKSFIGGSRPKYDFSLYFGVLLPNLIIIAYLTLYEGNFARLSAQPDLTKGFFLFVFLSFGFLPVQVEVKRFILRLRRERRYINAKDVNAEDMCPICMQGLTEQVEVKADSDEQIKTITEHRDDEDPRPLRTNTLKTSKILKTECGHLFHESCLNEWFKIKAECPSCRKPVVDFM